MEAAFAVMKWLHVAAGSVALVTFWLPWAVRKGSTLHRRAGWAFVVAMATLAATGLALCAQRLLDADPSNDPFALFLCYVALLSASSASLGVRSLRTKRRTGPSRNAWDLGLPAALALFGALVIATGLRRAAPTFAAFGVVGVLTGAGQLRFLLRAPPSRTEYLLQHIGAMGAACIAAVTAFLVVNARHLGVSGASVVLWVGPAIIGAFFIARWQRRYRVTPAV